MHCVFLVKEYFCNIRVVFYCTDDRHNGVTTYATKIGTGGIFWYNAGYTAHFVANFMSIKKMLSHNSGIRLQLRYGQFSGRWYVRNFDVVNASRKRINHEY